MQSRNCPKCGKTMTFEAGNEPTFCSNCGERLNGQRDAEIIAPDNLLTSQMVTEEEKQILLKKLEIETKRTGFIERTRKIRVICGTILCLVATVLPIVTSKVQPDFGMELIVFITNIFLLILATLLFFVRHNDYGWTAAPVLKKYRKSSYATVETGLRAAGFDNIECLPLYDLKSTADMKRQDEVEQITIGGKSMEPGKKYPPDAKVIITYHSAENKRIF